MAAWKCIGLSSGRSCYVPCSYEMTDLTKCLLLRKDSSYEMPALTKWQLLPDDSPMHFHAAIPYSGRRFGTTSRFFLVAAGGVPWEIKKINLV